MTLTDKTKDSAASYGGTARLVRWASYASVTTATVLILVKLVAWQLTDALSMLATLIDSLLDVAASLVTLLALRHAQTPADSDHRFGHGKAEPLAALGQSAFVMGSAIFLFIEATHRLVTPRAVEHGRIGIAVMVFSILATLALVTFQAFVVRRSGSIAIKADSVHYKGDLLMNCAVIAAIVMSTEWDWGYADPLFGLGIAFYIIYVAWQVARGALDMLMDRELPDAQRNAIKGIILGNAEVKGLHDLRTRESGPQVFIQCHVELDGAQPLVEAHDVAERIEFQLQAAYPGAEVIIHQDPYPQAAAPDLP